MMYLMKTSIKITLGILILILAAVAIILLVTKKHHQVVSPVSPVKSFTWRYEKGGNDLDGMPKTQIILDVVYENGKFVSKKIDEVQGSCNVVNPSSKDTDQVKNSTQIQCYAAGFGERYKIVTGDQVYNVVRKNFVEAEPDSVPPNYQYEVVAEIPLVQ